MNATSARATATAGASPAPTVPAGTGTPPTLWDLLGLAGIPVAVDDGVRTRDGRAWDALVGGYVHRAVAELAPHVHDIAAIDLGDRVLEVAARLVGSPRVGNLASARGRVAGMTSTYLQRLAPPSGTRFLGAEVPAPAGGVAGRADLAWEHPTAGVFYDELKSWRQVLAVLDGGTKEQVSRYLEAGQAEHGERFAGIRVITLAALPRSLWVDAHGVVRPLPGSPLEPRALALAEAAA